MRGLIDGCFGVQFNCLKRTPNQISRHPLCHQIVVERAFGDLTSTDNNGVYLKRLRLASDQDMQPTVIDAHILDCIDHVNAATIQQDALCPSRCFTQPTTNGGIFALH